MDRAEAIRYFKLTKAELNTYGIAEIAGCAEYIDMAIAALNEQDCAKNAHCNEWISVKDDLPKKDGSYLVATKNGGVMLTHFYPKGKRFSSTRLNRLVTHWMERPKPPKEGADHV